MYADDITATAVAAASARRVAANRAPLTPHTPDEIAQAIEHFDALLRPDKDGKIGTDAHADLTRDLSPDEIDYLSNERQLCALDFRYWLHYVHIIDWAKRRVPFVPNVAQEIILDIWGDLERKATAILMIELKARQLGATTLTEMAICHRFQFHARTNAVVASSDPKKSAAMAKMLRYCLEQQPWWLKPRVTKFKDMLPAEFGEIDTSLTVEAGNQFSGIARGSTPNVFHLSEVSTWVDAEQLIDAALFKAIHPTPDVFGILESTAFGRGNWFHHKWERAKIDFPRQQGLLCPVFLPWFVGYDIYPTKADLRARPIPVDWAPDDRTIRHAERAKAYVNSNGLLRKYLAKGCWDWQMPREQLWFYEIERHAAIAEKKLNIFLSEMPSDDQEAFQSTNLPVIDQEALMGYRERTRHPQGVYTIIGNGIPETLRVSRRQWDSTQPVVTVESGAILPRFPSKYQLVPVQFDGYPGYDASLKLFVWEPPIDGETYGIGVDTSEGIGQDAAVIEVVRKATAARPNAQVAEFASSHVTAFQFWPLVLAIALYYSGGQVGQHSLSAQRSPRHRQCRLSIECKSNGEVIQIALQDRGWSNFYMDMLWDKKQRMTIATARKIGIHTNVKNRAQIIDMMLTEIDDDTIDLPSPYLVSEMESLELDPRKQKLAAGYGQHDDLFFASAFALFGLHMGEKPEQRFRTKIEYLPDAAAEVAPVYATWAHPQQARDSGVSGRPSGVSYPLAAAARRQGGALGGARGILSSGEIVTAANEGRMLGRTSPRR